MANAGERSLVVLQGAWALQDVHSALTAHGMSSDTATVTSDPAMAPNGPFSSLLLLLPSPPSPALLGSVTRLLVPGASAVLQLRMGAASTVGACALIPSPLCCRCLEAWSCCSAASCFLPQRQICRPRPQVPCSLEVLQTVFPTAAAMSSRCAVVSRRMHAHRTR